LLLKPRLRCFLNYLALHLLVECSILIVSRHHNYGGFIGRFSNFSE
jgi:hypothetical protein